LKIQREICHPKFARKVSGLSRNGPQETVNFNAGVLEKMLPLIFIIPNELLFLIEIIKALYY